jgi:hypothetical protein
VAELDREQWLEAAVALIKEEEVFDIPQDYEPRCSVGFPPARVGAKRARGFGPLAGTNSLVSIIKDISGTDQIFLSPEVSDGNVAVAWLLWALAARHGTEKGGTSDKVFSVGKVSVGLTPDLGRAPYVFQDTTDGTFDMLTFEANMDAVIGIPYSDLQNKVELKEYRKKSQKAPLVKVFCRACGYQAYANRAKKDDFGNLNKEQTANGHAKVCPGQPEQGGGGGAGCGGGGGGGEQNQPQDPDEIDCTPQQGGGSSDDSGPPSSSGQDDNSDTPSQESSGGDGESKDTSTDSSSGENSEPLGDQNSEETGEDSTGEDSTGSDSEDNGTQQENESETGEGTEDSTSTDQDGEFDRCDGCKGYGAVQLNDSGYTLCENCTNYYNDDPDAAEALKELNDEFDIEAMEAEAAAAAAEPKFQCAGCELEYPQNDSFITDDDKVMCEGCYQDSMIHKALEAEEEKGDGNAEPTEEEGFRPEVVSKRPDAGREGGGEVEATTKTQEQLVKDMMSALNSLAADNGHEKECSCNVCQMAAAMEN